MGSLIRILMVLGVAWQSQALAKSFDVKWDKGHYTLKLTSKSLSLTMGGFAQKIPMKKCSRQELQSFWRLMTNSATNPKVTEKRKGVGIAITLDNEQYRAKYMTDYGRQLRTGHKHFQMLDAKVRKACR